MQQDGYALIDTVAGTVQAEWAALPDFVDIQTENGTVRIYGPAVGHVHDNFKLVERFREATPLEYVPNLFALVVGATVADVENDRAFRPVTAVPTATDQLHALIKEEARQRIVAAYPEWKQRNMMARSSELLRKGESNWSSSESDEVNAMDAVWAWIKSVRAASDAIEMSPPADGDIANDARWPAEVT